MRIESDRLIMRAFTESDINDAYEYLSNEDTMYYIENPFTLEETRNFIIKYGLCEKPYVYALVEKYSNKVIGHIIFHIAENDEIYELGCIIEKEFQHKGYGYEIFSSIINDKY